MQSCLTLVWTLRVPPLQSASPASLVAQTLLRLIPPHRFANYTFVDFCAGAGGPTPTIERLVNDRLLASSPPGSTATTPLLNGSSTPQSAQFVLTDLHPHLPSWTALSKRSSNLTFAPTPIDASAAPHDLLSLTPLPSSRPNQPRKKIFRLFNLAFHHFDDPLAARILENTIETSDAFGIFELQDRSLASFITILALGVLLMGISGVAFWGDWGQLAWTYILPVVPVVVVLDGFVSCLRTRTREEVERLMPAGWREQGWKIRSGREIHTWPVGRMTWVVGVKDTKDLGPAWGPA